MTLFLRSSVIAAALMTASSSAGLVVDGVYRDNALVEASWRGNDLVTLVLAVPLLVGATIRARRGSTRGLLLCLGMLAYAAYNYAFYLFGAAFNSLFLVYVGILTFSTLGLIGGLASKQVRSLVQRVSLRSPERRVGWLIVAVSSLLGLFWVATSVAFLFTGEVPAMVVATEHPTNVTGALDLWLVVTFGMLGGSWLIRNGPWGFVVSALWTVKGAVYMTALSAASVSAFYADAAESLAQLGLWIPVGLACLLGALVLLRRGGALAGVALSPGPADDPVLPG